MTCLLARGRGKPVTHIRSTNNKPQPYDQLRSLCVCVCVCQGLKSPVLSIVFDRLTKRTSEVNRNFIWQLESTVPS